MAEDARKRLDELFEAAQRHADSFGKPELPSAPARELAIVTCMDCRIDVYGFLGLRPGEAHVIRNAGGLVTDDVLRSLTLSQGLLGTREVMVIQHTGCGLNDREESLRERVKEATGESPPWELGGFEDLEESVRRQVERLRSAEQLPHGDNARGFVYEVETGRLREVTS